LLLGSHELKMEEKKERSKREEKKNHRAILVPLLIYDGHITHESTSES